MSWTDRLPTLADYGWTGSRADWALLVGLVAWFLLCCAILFLAAGWL